MLMLKKLKWLGYSCIVMASMTTIVQASPLNELQDLLKPIITIKANFTQTVLNKQSKIVQKASGNMEFKRPNLFRWQIDKPDPTLIVTDGKKMWNYDIELEQVTVQNFRSNTEVSPISFLFDDVEQLDRDFNIVKVSTARSTFKLTPKQENSSFISVELNFEQNNIKDLRLLDHLGQTSQFNFTQVQNNPKIANTRFTFVPPVGVDVIGEL